MKLSVVMAVRDQQSYVAEAIESVLGQTYSDFEFVIVDDGSCDDTARILKQYQQRDARIRLLRNPTPRGPYPSANRGMAAARGRFIARHDGDDISPPGRLATQVEILQSDPRVSLVTGAIETFGRDQPTQVKRPPRWQPRLEWELLFRNVVGAGAHVMFPRVWNGSAVSFPERYPYAEDYHLWCTLSRLGCIVCPDTVVYRHRQHPQSITSSRRGEQSQCFATMRHHYQREYAGPGLDYPSSLTLARFWSPSAERPGRTFNDVRRVLTPLRQRFLEYVRGRWGAEVSGTLDRDIESALRHRLPNPVISFLSSIRERLRAPAPPPEDNDRVRETRA